MEIVIIISIVVVILGIVSLIVVTTCDKFRENIIRLNEAEASIDAALNKRFDLLKKSIEFIDKEVNKGKTEDEEKIKVMHTIAEIRSKNLSKFEFDTSLYDAIDEFKNYSDEHIELKKNNDFVKIEVNLIESESEIVALKKYYNDISKEYNDLVKKFPANIIAFFKKYKKKEYFSERETKQSILDELKA